MHRIDCTVKVLLLAIAGSLGMIAVRPLIDPGVKALAQSARFDHIYIVSPLFLYKGEQGLLVLDRRNANVWFMPKQNDTFAGHLYKDPIFVTRVPFEKLDHGPQ